MQAMAGVASRRCLARIGYSARGPEAEGHALRLSAACDGLVTVLMEALHSLTCMSCDLCL